MSTLPAIPESAPFSPAQRLWLNGYIAGLVSSDEGSSPGVASKPKVRVPIIYASQSGNSEGLAETYSEQLGGMGFDCPCLAADDLGDLDLTKEKNLLLISSTWGDGDPPDNAVDFWETLQAEDHPKLEGLTYSVLALGDSNYIDFCGQGKAFDARLEALGASRMAARVDCDTDFEEPADEWFATVLEELKKQDPEAGDADGGAPAKKEEGYSKKNPFPAKLKTNLMLNAEDSARDTRHFEIDLSGSGMSYECGDVLGVYPQNNPAHVDEMIAALGFSPDDVVSTPDHGDRPLRTALLEDFDIRTLSVKFLSEWAEKSGSEELAAIAGSDDKSVIENFLWGREIIDLVTGYPIEFAAPTEFTSLLRKLGARLYSISSSPNAHPDEVHLTVAKVTYESHGRAREGVCSTFLSDRVNDGLNVGVFLQAASHFKLPTDLSTDVIMCGPGTGIAPFRSFLEEREFTKADGRNWLFFGNPHESTDFLYQDQLLGMKDKGVLTRLDLAWSRDGDEKVYVQDRMLQAGEELWQWFESGAHFYICGDAKRMAKDVDDALHTIARRHGNLDEAGAASYIKMLVKEKRYQRDVY